MRPKKHKEHVNHERWLVSYADFITLLFAFFVVLYSSSQVDARKIGKLQLSITAAFQSLGLFPTQSTKVPLTDAEPLPFSDAQIFENITRSSALGRIAPSMSGDPGGAGGSTGNSDLKSKLEKALAPEILHQQVEIKQRPEGIVLSLHEMGFYEAGSDILRSDAKDTLAKIAGVLGTTRYQLRIEGHTDNVPVRPGKFLSNWELSTARATGLVHVFISEFGLVPASLSAAGYAEFHPVATNDTAEGRRLNRRVDLVILGQFEAEADGVQLASNASSAVPDRSGAGAHATPHASSSSLAVPSPALAPPTVEPGAPQVVSQVH